MTNAMNNELNERFKTFKIQVPEQVRVYFSLKLISHVIKMGSILSTRFLGINESDA